MKKLLIAFAALIVGVTANAASYNWGLTSYDYLGPDGSGYSDADGMNLYSAGTAFLYLGTITYDNGFKTDGATFLSSAGYDDGMYAYGQVDDSDVTALPSNDSVLAAGGQAYSIVLVDTNASSLDDASIQNYIIVTGESTSSYDPGTEMTYASFVDWTTVIGGDGVAWSPASAEPIPEPTSGLLLLLGMAGLALKRKRA